MSKKSRAAAARAEKRNGVKKERQRGDKVVREAVDAMHAETAEEAAIAAENDQSDEPEDGSGVGD